MSDDVVNGDQTGRTLGIHQGGPVFAAGVPLKDASAAMILVHGRGASARDILSLSAELQQPGFAYVAPQASGGTWYPYPFMEPMEKNEPALSSALLAVGETLAQVTAHVPPERVIILGFSQGACLTLEFSARNPRRYGGIVGLSGGLIGPDSTPRDYPGSLEGTPFFLGCSDIDFHIPKERVEEAGRVLTRMGGKGTVRLYPNMGHNINRDEIAEAIRIMASVGEVRG